MRLFILSLFSFLFGFFISAQEIDRSKSALLWEISGNGLEEASYLFGTFHSNDNRLFQFPDSVLWALYTTNGVVLETDITGLMDDIEVRNAGYDLNSITDEMRYIVGKKRAQSSLNLKDTGRPQFIDLYFQRVTENCNKNLYTLENVTAQLELISPDISYTVNENAFEQLKVDLTPEKLKLAYLEGNIVKLLQLTKSSASIFDGFYEDLILKRNDLMAIGIDSLIRRESLFCAVGAAHLAGERGIISQLKNKGFTLRRVIPVYNEKVLKEHYQLLKSCDGYLYSDSLFGFNLYLPGKPKVYNQNNQLELFFEEWGQGNLYVAKVFKGEEALSEDEIIQQFFTNSKGKRRGIKTLTLDNNAKVYEAFFEKKEQDSYWIRVINLEHITYILTCTGSYKFLHSQRPHEYFQAFSMHQ
ncbi:MAG: TraB/GumN family protein [Lishizhenia sp.]